MKKVNKNWEYTLMNLCFVVAIIFAIVIDIMNRGSINSDNIYTYILSHVLLFIFACSGVALRGFRKDKNI